ncbi:hypothetical protein [Methylovirgula sp. 4M-Z18]|uniref:hypothetical protein n=1 Tax=Methylovirgula sp. 4M-Z18 TaxID=2293567 RepID=UPI000E2F85D7|nr:hypothetical protein [Methylovirgula sp. 4M-Z18]RFB80414.1 hypothetical protein DYH55_02480 [Methylovirgula sp. 4M-Z18]
MRLIINLNDQAFNAFRTKLAALAEQGPQIMASALNAGGDALRNATVVAETAQTGLTRDTIDRAQHATPASPGRLTYVIQAHGGNVRLKFFGAREGGGGVTAHPWNRSTFYQGAFITSGRPGARAVSPKLNGQVYVNIQGRKWGGKIKQERSGLFIPTEMTKGATAQAFESQSQVVLNGVMTRLAAMMP